MFGVLSWAWVSWASDLWLVADNVDRRGEMVSQATGHWAHVSVSPPSCLLLSILRHLPASSQGAAVWSQQKVQITKYKMSLIMSEIFDETRDLHAAITASTESSNAVDRRGTHVPVFNSELFISWKVNVIILWPLSTIYRNREQYNRPRICVTVEPCLCYHSWGGHSSSSCVKRFCLLASLHQVI